MTMDVAAAGEEAVAARPQRTALQEWRAAWPLPLTAALGVSVSILHTYSLGVFIEPIERETGWSRALITSGLTIKSVVAVMLGPVVGLMIDRYGPRRLGIAGLALYCFFFSLLGLTGPMPVMWWGLWLMLSLAFCGVQPAVWAAAVGSRFNASRGLAFGVVFCGGSLGVGLIPVLSEQILRVVGWRMAYPVLGGGAALLVLPLLFLFFRSSSDQYVRGARGHARRGLSGEVGLSRREALTSTRFYRLAGAALILQSATAALAVHFVPILSDAGIARGEAVGIAAVIGIFSLIGRLSSGFLVDRMDGRIVGTVAALLVATAYALMLGFDGSTTTATLVAATGGFAFGAEIDLLAYLVSRYFGLRCFGFLFGIVSGLIALATGMGPFIAGLVYDNYGTYQPVFTTMVPLALVAAVLVATLGRMPSFEDEQQG